MKIRTRILAIVYVVSISGCDGTAVDRMPSVAVEPASLYLGDLDFDSGVTEAEIRVTNRGSADLKLRQASSSCGCTVVKWPARVIKPGHSTIIIIQVKPRPESGLQSSTVSLVCNDPATPEVKIPIQWKSTYSIAFEPSSLDLGWISVDHSVERDVVVLTKQPVTSDSLDLRSSDPALTFQWNSTTDAVSDENPAYRLKRLRIRLHPTAAQGTQSAALMIQDREGFYQARLPITWMSGPRVQVFPTRVFRGGIAPRSLVDGRLIVSAPGGSRLTIDHIELDGSRVDDSIASVSSNDGASPGDESRALVKFAIKAGESPGVERHVLEIFFGEDTGDMVSIPVTILIKDQEVNLGNDHG